MTVRLRLAAAYGVAMIGTLALMGAITWLQVGSALRSSLDQTLQTRASAVVTATENTGQAGLQEGGAGEPAGVFVVLVDGAGRTIDATSNVPPGFSAPAPDAAAATVSVGLSRYATYTVAGEGGVRAVAGSDLAGIASTLDGLARTLLFAGGLASIVSLAGGWWLAGGALRPVAAITAEADQIGAADIDRRLPVPRQRDELRSLATTLNSMLDRVAEAMRRQHAFVTAASHDLRTPLAALRAELELADTPDASEDDLREAIRRAHADAVRLGDLATGLLGLAEARADGRSLVRGPVSVAELVDSAVRRVEPVARERQVSITTAAPEGIVRVDRVRIEQALANVILNAVVHGPAQSEVAVVASLERGGPGATGRDRAWLALEVLDRGPGIAADPERRLFEPFQRGRGARASGSGLGLATAAAALDAHHGEIGFEPRDGGGTRFWMRLPA